mmetsp:Transcript_5090/g.14319  ORF Transcript_5090/g.14319 Transcript_5090/m.14319 type:complete len:219 (+) Transcript_5090:909-1565(+)
MARTFPRKIRGILICKVCRTNSDAASKSDDDDSGEPARIENTRTVVTKRRTIPRIRMMHRRTIKPTTLPLSRKIHRWRPTPISPRCREEEEEPRNIPYHNNNHNNKIVIIAIMPRTTTTTGKRRRITPKRRGANRAAIPPRRVPNRPRTPGVPHPRTATTITTTISTTVSKRTTAIIEGKCSRDNSHLPPRRRRHLPPPLPRLRTAATPRPPPHPLRP